MGAGDVPLTVNGTAHVVPGPLDRTLLEVLRVELGLTGTKYGCGEGECGSCTVLLGDEPSRSCQVRLGEVGSRPILTIEGLAPGGQLSPVQTAFAESGAFQCGYCTPGMIMRITGLIRKEAHPSTGSIRSSLEGNLCRCCGYGRILAAAERSIELAAADHGP